MQFILKGIPLVVGILLTIFLPYILDDKTHQYATDRTLIKSEKKVDRNPHDSLDWVLRWRDLIIAVFTGIFVLQFAAAEEITSTSQKIAFIPLPFNWHLSDVALFFTIILMPVFLIFAFLLSLKLKTTDVQSDFAYWLKFSLLVMPFYIISFLFVYST
jgi:hypothetical protein